jgi:hypothetical protein
VSSLFRQDGDVRVILLVAKPLFFFRLPWKLSQGKTRSEANTLLQLVT